MISQVQTKILLQNYNLIPSKIKALDSAIKAMRSSQSRQADVYNASVQQNISDMPFPPEGNVSNKVQDIALSAYDNVQKDIDAHTQLKNTLEYVLEQLDIAVDSLDKTRKILVQGLYIQNLSCDELSKQNSKDDIGFWSEDTYRRKALQGAEQVGNIVVFGQKEYTIVAEALNLN